MRYFLGIDNGGTMTKSALFDQSGAEIAVCALDTPLLTPKDGWNERDMDELWSITQETVRCVLKKSGIDPAMIAGIGCTGHGKGLYLWGKDGKPAANAVASTDHRAAEIVKRLQTLGVTQKAREKILQELRDCQPVPLLIWFKENQPDVYKNIRWIFEAKDYIRFRLTGAAYAEATDYSGTGLMNLLTASFDPELLELYGIPETAGCLPPLKASCDHCGSVTPAVAAETGLTAGTPVCGGMFDIDACALAMDVLTDEKLCVITGTWSINEYVAKAPVQGSPTTLNSLFCVPGYYLIEESSPTSAGNLSWVMDVLREKEFAKSVSAYAAVNAGVASVHPADSDVVFLPFLYGSNSGYERGAFLNLSNKTSQAELYRAVFEGVVYSHKTHIDRLLRLRTPPKAIRIAGGAVNSEVWLQIFADIIGIPLEVVDTKELGTLGAAMAASVCAGVWEDYHEAAKNMVAYQKTILPNPDTTEIYRRKYEAYKSLTGALSPA